MSKETNRRAQSQKNHPTRYLKGMRINCKITPVPRNPRYSLIAPNSDKTCIEIKRATGEDGWRTNVHKVKCTDCGKCNIGQTKKKVITAMHGHKLATGRHDPTSLKLIHQERGRHKLKLDNVEILDQATTRHTRESEQPWYASNNPIN